jgi:hypothetical protein
MSLLGREVIEYRQAMTSASFVKIFLACLPIPLELRYFLVLFDLLAKGFVEPLEGLTSPALVVVYPLGKGQVNEHTERRSAQKNWLCGPESGLGNGLAATDFRDRQP